MSPDAPRAVTQLLQAWSRGDAAAGEQLLPIVYAELRRQAAGYMRRERPGQTLQATALVHEAYLRLVDQDVVWESRAHFFAIAAQAMRRVLVDHARRRRAAKRGGPLPAMSLDETVEWPAAQAVDVEELDEALDELARLDPQQSRIVELRFFGGLSIEETAQAVGASASTVKREWNSARTWLYRRLKQV